MDIADEPLNNHPGKQIKLGLMLKTFVAELAKLQVDDAEVMEAISGARLAAIEGKLSINEVLKAVAEVLERKKSKVKDLPRRFRTHYIHFGLTLSDPKDARRLLGAYASSSSQLPPQIGGNERHRQALVRTKMLELSNKLVRILRSPAWQHYAATKPVVASLRGPIPLRMPPEDAEEYLEYLATDWHGGKPVSRPDEAFCILRAVYFGVIKGPVLRPKGRERIDFIAFGPTFDGYGRCDATQVEQHLSTLSHDLAAPQFEGNAIILDLKNTNEDSPLRIKKDMENIEDKLSVDPAMHVVLVMNHMPYTAILDLQSRHKPRQILPFYDDSLDKVGLDASGLWSFPM